MCDVGNIILNSVLTFASVWIVRKFLDTFYEKKRWNVLSVSVWLIYIIFQGYVQFHSGDASVVTTIVNVLLCIMISAISYYGLNKIIYVFLTIFLYLLKCPQSLILSALRAFCFCGKPHISRSIFLYFLYQTWLKSW
jgi:two-component system sensor histidine kinase AgrC